MLNGSRFNNELCVLILEDIVTFEKLLTKKGMNSTILRDIKKQTLCAIITTLK